MNLYSKQYIYSNSITIIIFNFIINRLAFTFNFTILISSQISHFRFVIFILLKSFKSWKPYTWCNIYWVSFCIIPFILVFFFINYLIFILWYLFLLFSLFLLRLWLFLLLFIRITLFWWWLFILYMLLVFLRT